jgi:UDP-N-acetyl-D-galactosamine dehydrogenase
VLEAAGTKWNFLKFSPGLVGGHCIGVDPYYLTSKAASLGYEAKVITASRFINDNMARNVARKIIRHVLRTTPDLNKASVLVKGVTFKENVSDIRNSKIIDTVKEILAFNIKVDIEDPYADGEEVLREYGLRLANSVGKEYDAVLITVPHDPYLKLEEDHYLSITKPTACIADLKGIMRNKIKQREYWTL